MEKRTQKKANKYEKNWKERPVCLKGRKKKVREREKI